MENVRHQTIGFKKKKTTGNTGARGVALSSQVLFSPNFIAVGLFSVPRGSTFAHHTKI